MLTHPTIEKLHELRCPAMAKALAEQLASPQIQDLSFEERLGLLVDREITERHSRQLTNRLRRAKLRHRACIEDVDFRQPRGLDKDLVLSLADGRWVREHLNVLITGPAGIGKSWIACALAHGACRNGYSAAYRRLTRLLTELSIARADGRYPKLLASLANTHVLVIDDFGLAKLSAENRRDLLEIIEDRHALRSTIVTSQFPVEKTSRRSRTVSIRTAGWNRKWRSSSIPWGSKSCPSSWKPRSSAVDFAPRRDGSGWVRATVPASRTARSKVG